MYVCTHFDVMYSVLYVCRIPRTNLLEGVLDVLVLYVTTPSSHRVTLPFFEDPPARSDEAIKKYVELRKVVFLSSLDG